MKSSIELLEQWFESQCDGDWEHRTAIKIINTDNPGWLVEIDISETEMEDKNYSEFEEDMDTVSDWVFCRVIDNKFQGSGGPKMLTRILDSFLKWVFKDQSNT